MRTRRQAPAGATRPPVRVRLQRSPAGGSRWGGIRRRELTHQERELLAPLISRAAAGRLRVADRQVINGMVYKIRTGISWRDLPRQVHPGPRRLVVGPLGRVRWVV
ncbi:transposase [Streptomyces sp. NPDC047725]|uniref:transposase n=1 Tax=Streptomyces sp. NPDC047725 TaxID=3365487 RepID=UPI00371308FF